MSPHEHLKRVYEEPDKVADEVATKVVDILGKPQPIQKIRNSQILTGLLGAVGLALFLVGLEQVLSPISGWAAVIAGFLILIITGVIFKKL